jgi:hypothetical protein
MSHTVTIETRFVDAAALAKACQEIGVEAPVEGEARFFDGKRAQGKLVKLPGWKYPLVVDAQGVAHFDHFGGHWGNPEHLTALRQEYAVAAITKTMSRQWRITRNRQADGTLRVSLSR